MTRAATPLWLLLATRAALADPATDATIQRADVVAAQAHFGLATAPFDAMTLPEAKGQALVFLVEGWYSLPSNVSLGLRAPFVLASVAQPAGSYVDAATNGNPQLRGARLLLDRRSDDTRLAVVGGVDLGAPLAGHSPTLMSNRALAIANGVEGLSHPELFTPGVVSVTAFANLQWTSAPWRVHAAVRLPLLLRISDVDLPDGGAMAHTLGAGGVVQAEGRRQITPRLELAAAAQLFIDIAPSVEHVRSVSRLQDLERISLGIGLGSRSMLMIDIQGAIGGELGGSTIGFGVRSLLRLP